jgi:hypothetical protein
MRPFGCRPPAAEGAFASFNPRFQTTGPTQAEPNGLALGRFGWRDPFTGLAYSARQAVTDLLGFVIPVPIQGVCMDWRYKYWDVTRKAFILRGGMEATLVTRADVWARFPGGSYVTQQVYANVLDGSCLAVDRNTGPVDGYELTPYSVVSECGPGELAIISSWSFFTP